MMTTSFSYRYGNRIREVATCATRRAVALRAAAVLTAVFIGCTALPAQAESFRDRYQRGNQYLQEGQLQQAIAVFQDLQVERPDSPHLSYALGLARYQQGLQLADQQAPEEAKEAFEKAKQAFETARSASTDPLLRANAGYNLSNTVAQSAKLTRQTGDQKVVLDAYEASVKAYEDFIDQHPNHARARHNRDHMRYEWKTMQQEQEQEQQQQQQSESSEEGEEEQEGEEQQQNQGDEGDQEQSESENQEDQQSDNQEEENQDEQSDASQNQQEQDEQQDHPEEGDEDQSSGSDEMNQSEQPQGSENEPDGSEAQASSEQMEDLPPQEIEAILDSLEEQDNREQADLREMKGQPQLRSKWW